MVVYRLLYAIFGVRTYLPYQVLIVALHLTVAALLRAIMRRAGVGPWLATAVASVYVFFGAGGLDILFAFQITFVGALAFGLTQLLLVDHDGPLDRRDWLALAAGLLAILCSGVALATVVVVGVFSLVRRGWRVALLQTAPPLGVYSIWWVTRGRGAVRWSRNLRVHEWTWNGLSGTFSSLTRVSALAVVVGVLFVAGLVYVWRQRGGARMLRTSAAMPIAMLVGALAFLVLTGIARASFGAGSVREGRYLDIVAALTLPAIAMAADALAGCPASSVCSSSCCS